MARDIYSTKQLSERNLFRLFWKNILTGLTENYMFKNNCRFYDVPPASQASHHHTFCFRQTLLCTAAGSHFWIWICQWRHWKDIGTIQCRRRGSVNTNISISRYKVLNLTSSLPWGCWTVKVIGYAMLEATIHSKAMFPLQNGGYFASSDFH